MTRKTLELLAQLVDQVTVSPAHPQAVQFMTALATARAEVHAAFVDAPLYEPADA